MLLVSGNANNKTIKIPDEKNAAETCRFFWTVSLECWNKTILWHYLTSAYQSSPLKSPNEHLKNNIDKKKPTGKSISLYACERVKSNRSENEQITKFPLLSLSSSSNTKMRIVKISQRNEWHRAYLLVAQNFHTNNRYCLSVCLSVRCVYSHWICDSSI